MMLEIKKIINRQNAIFLNYWLMHFRISYTRHRVAMVTVYSTGDNSKWRTRFDIAKILVKITIFEKNTSLEDGGHIDIPWIQRLECTYLYTSYNHFTWTWFMTSVSIRSVGLFIKVVIKSMLKQTSRIYS